MKRLFTIMTCLLAMMAASLSVKAQEVTITLMPGWNWISYPNAVAMEIGEALNGFVPANGDMIKSQASFSSYQYGYWIGGITHFMPGWGYKYYSNRSEIVSLVFNAPPMPTGTLTVTTSEPTNITSTTAVCGGSAVSNDGTTILMKGVCWATHPEPTTNDFYTETESGPGAFTTTITELTPETVYYVRAYAVSVKGINYGEELSFTTVPQGILNGLFSVGENTQVCFSQGNLQYQASTNTWRFAENQWDYVGEDNNNASSTYEGWIDIYEWGTSGFDHGAEHYLPWSSGGWNYCWAVYGSDDYDLNDMSGQADWGYNAISNGGNQERQWRTCRASEWQYLLETRQTTSGIRFAKAIVNGINGLIILPDNWNSNIYDLNNGNDGNASFEVNVISLDDWSTVLESNGAVFLPAAGSACDGFGASGHYWTSSHGPTPWLKCLIDFDDDFVHTTGSYFPNCKYSVRLVRPLAGTSYSIEAVPSPTEGGTITGTGIYDYYTTATLTAIPNEGYTFYQWKEHGNVVSTESTYSVVALFDRNLEACFYENTTYPLLYSYNEDDHTATVTGRWEGVQLEGELVIPETVMHNGESYTVTAIGSNAFYGCSGLTSLSFCNTMTFIGESAFEGCSNLTSITIPNSVTSIGNWTFSHCNSLTEITIPNSVSHIGINPFHDCTNLAQITVELGNLYYDSRNNCNAIIETSSNSLISGSLNTVIPNSVTAICRDAFLQIPITTISIPASVVRIDMSAFALTSLSEIKIYADIPPLLNDGPFYGVDKSIPVYVPCGSLEAYQNAEGWNEFTNFIETCDTVPTGAINGKFTINENGDQVYFSQGNLQYQASTNIWRFAENQWDYVGDNTNGTVYEGGTKCNNSLISSTYNGWIDLFGWGTSGYNHGAVCYQPWSISENDSNYYAYGSSIYNLNDQTGQADWGYNSISNGGNQENLWRGLSNEEWNYLLNSRNTTSNIRYAKAYLNGIAGLVIMPDNWNESLFGFSSTNNPSASYSTNSISLADWNDILQPLGVVFLPATGCRKGNEMIRFEWGLYWTSSCISSSLAYPVSFNSSHLDPPNGYDSRHNGQSVRLIRSVQTAATHYINAVPYPTEGGSVTGVGTYEQNTSCTLTAISNEGYSFVNWTENGEVFSTDATYSFIVTGDRNLVANFSSYGYVDLGLPSGLLWATCNVGANSPEEHGDYFAWGETQTKDTYNWSTYQYCMDSDNTLTKYCNNSSYGYNGFTDSLTILLQEDDAATANWGSEWRMPTKAEWEELCDNTTSIWTTQNGVNGRLFTSSNGNSLFLPAAGFRSGNTLNWLNNYGYYWSSSLVTADPPNKSWMLGFSSSHYRADPYYRYLGKPVRAVRSSGQN